MYGSAEYYGRLRFGRRRVDQPRCRHFVSTGWRSPWFAGTSQRTAGSPDDKRAGAPLWSELIGIHPDSWPVWTRHEISLSPLVDKWVEAIRSVVYRANGGMGSVKNAHFPERPVEERWANKLRRRIEVGPNV